MSHIIISSVN